MNARTLFLVIEERKQCEFIVVQLGKFPEIKHRAIMAIARNLLLKAPYMWDGKSFDIEAKSLGAGVYEISRKECI